MYQIDDLSKHIYLEAGLPVNDFYEDCAVIASLAKDAYFVSGEIVGFKGEGKAVKYDGTTPLGGIVKMHVTKDRFYDHSTLNMLKKGTVTIKTPTAYSISGKEYTKLYVKPDGTLSTTEADGVLLGSIVENSITTNVAKEYITFVDLEII